MQTSTKNDQKRVQKYRRKLDKKLGEKIQELQKGRNVILNEDDKKWFNTYLQQLKEPGKPYKDRQLLVSAAKDLLNDKPTLGHQLNRSCPSNLHPQCYIPQGAQQCIVQEPFLKYDTSEKCEKAAKKNKKKEFHWTGKSLVPEGKISGEPVQFFDQREWRFGCYYTNRTLRDKSQDGEGYGDEIVDAWVKSGWKKRREKLAARARKSRAQETGETKSTK